VSDSTSGMIQIAGLGVTATPVPLAEVAIQLQPDDDVAVAKVELPPRRVIDGPWGRLKVSHLIPVGHKVALREVPEGGSVHRYGQIIGFATVPIAPGDHVHSHNLAVHDFARDANFGVDARPVAYVPAERRRTFQGFLRADGRVGTRNYVTVISTVNCSATVTQRVADRFREGLRERYPNVDGVIPITHKAGCAARYGGPEIAQLQRTLAGFAHHPNVGAYVIIGLGCEGNQVHDLLASQGLEGDAPPVFVIQDEGGLAEAVEAGVRAVEELLPKVNEARRTTQSAEHLMVALQCGGSDAWSGVTANPAVGLAADEVVRQGGTVVLGETTEVYGAEHLLARRAVSPEVGEALLERIHWWEEHTAMLGAEIDNNPSPGNKAGGLTTIYEKSLGAIAKSGSTPLTAVVRYAHQVTDHGFVHMDTPGYDPVSVTGQVAGGCNLVVFTTGRGSVFGFKPSPSIKVATNPVLYRKMEADMDINAGRVLEGGTLEEVGQEIFEKILAVASGEHSKSEAQGVGEEEFNPWILGATL